MRWARDQVEPFRMRAKAPVKARERRLTLFPAHLKSGEWRPEAYILVPCGSLSMGQYRGQIKDIAEEQLLVIGLKVLGLPVSWPWHQIDPGTLALFMTVWSLWGGTPIWVGYFWITCKQKSLFQQPKMKCLCKHVAKYFLVSLKLRYRGENSHVKHTALLLSDDVGFFRSTQLITAKTWSFVHHVPWQYLGHRVFRILFL